MLKVLFMILFLVGTVFLHAWLYLYADLEPWQLLATVLAEALLVMLAWKLSSVLRQALALLRWVVGFLEGTVCRLAALSNLTVRRLGWILRVRRLWWRLPHETGSESWYWLMADNGHDLPVSGRHCLRTSANDQLQLQLWRNRGAIIVRQQVLASSVTIGTDTPDAKFLQHLTDTHLLSRLGPDNCAGLICQVLIPDEEAIRVPLTGQWLKECLQPMLERVQHAFPTVWPPLTLVVDCAEIAQDLGEMLATPSNEENGRVIQWSLTECPHGEQNLIEAMEQMRVVMMGRCETAQTRIKALKLPSRMRAIDTAVRNVYRSVAQAGQRWRIAVRYQAEYQGNPVSGNFTGQRFALDRPVSDLWRGKPAGSTRSVSVMKAFSAWRVTPIVISGIFFSLWLSFLYRSHALQGLNELAMYDKTPSVLEKGHHLLRRHETLAGLNWPSWPILPGQKALIRVLRQDRTRLSRITSDLIADKDSTAGAYQKLLRRLLMRFLRVSGEIGISSDRKQSDLEWLITELCHEKDSALLCRGQDLIRVYASLVWKAQSGNIDLSYWDDSDPGPRRSEEWFKLFNSNYTPWSPNVGVIAVPYVCTGPGLEKLRVLLDLFRRYGPEAASSDIGLEVDMAAHCNRVWYQAAEKLGRSCELGGSSPVLGPESVQARFLSGAAEAKKTLNKMAGNVSTDEILQQLSFLEQLSPAIHQKLSPHPGAEFSQQLRRQGVWWLSDLRRRWQLRTGTLAGTPGLPVNSSAAAGELYGDFLSALHQLHEQSGDINSASTVVAGTLEEVSPTGPVVSAWAAIEQWAARSVADNWSASLETLMRCRVRSLWDRTLKTVAVDMGNKWKDLTAGFVETGSIDRLRQYYGPDGYLNAFAKDALRPFLLRRDGTLALSVNTRYGHGLPVKSGFLRALTVAAAIGDSFGSAHRVNIDIQPVTASGDAGVNPHRLQVYLQCPDPQVVKADNYRVHGTLSWRPGACEEVRLQVHIGKQVLVHRYEGQSGMLKFVSDFLHGSKTFKPGDFSVLGGGVLLYDVRKLTVRLKLTLSPGMGRIAEAARIGIPEGPV